MPQQIELTDMLSGITETYASPLWQLIELIAQRRGSLVILRDTVGRRHTIPVQQSVDMLAQLFSDWPSIQTSGRKPRLLSRGARQIADDGS